MAKAKPYYAQGGLSVAFYDVITEADVRLRGDEEIYAALAPPPPLQCLSSELGPVARRQAWPSTTLT